MALESASFVSQLVHTNPAGTDLVSFGDDHLRLIKSVLKTTLPNANQEINGIHASATEPTLNSPGLIWYDTTNDLLKIRNKADTGWEVIASVGSTSGATMVTQSYGRFAEEGGVVVAGTDWTPFGASGLNISHVKLSETSALYIEVQGQLEIWNGGSVLSQSAYIRLANSTTTDSIANVNDEIYAAVLRDGPNAGWSSVSVGSGFSYKWRVAAADCPDGVSGTQNFRVLGRLASATAGNMLVADMTYTVTEIEE